MQSTTSSPAPAGAGRLTIIALDVDQNIQAQRQIEEIARLSGGTVISAADTTALRAVFATAVINAPPAPVGGGGGGGGGVPVIRMGSGSDTTVGIIAGLLGSCLVLAFLLLRMRSRR